MKRRIWLFKSAAIELWSLKAGAMAWLAKSGAIAMAVLTLGWAGAAVWEMVFFPVSVGGDQRELTARAPLNDCERKLAKLPAQLKVDGGAPVQFSCRVEKEGQWLERWRASPEDSVTAFSKKDPSLSEFGRLDHLAWRESDPRPSWRGFAELMGWAELTEASRGWGSGARSDSVVEAAFVSVKGWILALGLLMGTLFHGIGLVMFLISLWVGFLWTRQFFTGAKGRWAVSAAVCVWILSGIAMSAAANMWPRLGEQQSARLTMAAVEDGCEERFGRVIERAPRGRWACREESGQMLLAGYAPSEWREERFKAEADRLFGSKAHWGAIEKAPEASLWQVFKELAALEPATIASRSKMGVAPRVWESAQWSWGRVLGVVDLLSLGCLVSAALAIIAIMTWILIRGVWRAGSRCVERALSVAEDPVFQARARAREARAAMQKR